ncbi:MAG: metallophosphatase [Pseudanabaena sp. RU_4_16]|nr:metallophosphatase [Pseudanabaena sp. RU_4_16]
MANWAILSGIEANLAAYEAVLEDIKRQVPKVTELYILGDAIYASPASEKVVQRIRNPRLGELVPQVCRGWWEEQCLILHGQSYQIEPNPLVEKYGAGTAKKLWDSIPRETVEWISNLHFAFAELDCLLLHGSSISVLEELSPQSSPLELLDRVVRTNANRLFCGRSGKTFRYQIKDGSVSSTVVTLDGEQSTQIFNTSERFIIGVGNVGHNPGQATYTLYSPGSDLVKFKTVRYGENRGFQMM